MVLCNWLISGLVHPQRGDDNPGLVAHVTIGIAVLLLTLIRIGWRYAHPWPPLPSAMPRWERLAARANHVAFYVLLLAIPLLGWATASAAPGLRRILLFGVLPWPQLPIQESKARFESLAESHGFGVHVLLVLLVLHVGGALWSTYGRRYGVLARMVPGLRPGAPKT